MNTAFSKEQIIAELQSLKNEGNTVRNTAYSISSTMPGVAGINTGIFKAWQAKILTMIDSKGIPVPEIRNQLSQVRAKYSTDIDSVQALLDAIIDVVDKEYIPIESDPKFDASASIENIFDKFHKVVRQLRTRHDRRDTLNVNDEYDVQDLLHALLLLYFDDVRPEEWTPSYAGGSARVDFLIKDCSTVIEVKKTRQSMTAKELGEQLIIDREKYRAHPDCKTLYCFVYDPDGFLGNPVGIKRDLESGNEDFVMVIIKPD